MRWAFAGICVFSAAAVVGPADARAVRCAMPEEMSAIQTAAIQQELMVAALTCNEVGRYNNFQTGYGPELRSSDATLLRMFRRMFGGRRGEAEYHSFKTKLANDSEMRSIHNNPVYCQEAAAVFTQALAPVKPALVTFVNGTPVMMERRPVEACSTVVRTERVEKNKRRHKG